MVNGLQVSDDPLSPCYSENTIIKAFKCYAVVLLYIVTKKGAQILVFMEVNVINRVQRIARNIDVTSSMEPV